ncbi:hypothetical protein NIES37_49920 [Tolypothrix tenuis PCC 7101]|uniref:eCIS core domain-containing protein n=1 Tax=Tolypothrix tenuis PCC 7101 TaxID=231146 RepID=A0A1Z4N5L2_9CYAN|nr:DUF4157 domain-containing protein [Aulosira sp. FACHB-113]BAZ00994.1 hypothetical protein NIES37_49920 [Tolypothrix tenuis PCC 7101]BAZ75083.1 hypothetical protein NIES50_36630 [Aulosira laxa NIES-50]
MVTFQFKRSRKAPAQENHESFFKKEGSNESHFFSSTQGNSIQAKLTIGKPNDSFEREADTVADAVVNHSSSDRNSQNISSQAIVQRQEDTLNSRIQRQEEPKKEEVQTKPQLQLAEEPKKEEVQTKPQLQLAEEPKKEEVQTKPELQLAEEPKKEEVQTKPELQLVEEPKKEEVQTKVEAGTQKANPSFSERLQNSKGRGNLLPRKIQAEMASAFGTDFSDVYIHTDEESVQMTRELKAQAFTYGKHIYFNQGKFDPDTVTGKHLLVHELTHVVQQNPDKHKIQ